MQKKDVLFLCQFFYPEYNSSATLPWDTAKYLAGEGLSVGVICGYPKEYNRVGNVPKEEEIANVHIKRLHYLQLKRGKKLGRLINYFSFTLSVLLHVRELKKYKCVVVYSNPPILPVVAVLANKLYNTKILFVSYDVYPEIAFASNSLSRNGMITRGMNRVNDILFRQVSTVVALTEEMKEYLLSHRSTLSDNRITVISNWAYEDKCEKKGDPYKRFGFSSDDFVVSYFGNMGICQDVETLLGAIDRLKDCDNIKFLIAGHGSKKDYVSERVKYYKNVEILDFLTGDDFKQALSISSCGIVSLEYGLCGMCAPSKYYSYLQSGIPVISVTEKGSYIAQEIVQEQIGRAIEIGDSSSMVDAIEAFASNDELCNSMISRAVTLYARKYSRMICLDKYFAAVKRILENE